MYISLSELQKQIYESTSEVIDDYINKSIESILIYFKTFVATILRNPVKVLPPQIL